MKTFKNFVAGAWVEPSTGQYFDNINPADTTDIMGRFPLATGAELEKAVATAKHARGRWPRTPAPDARERRSRAQDWRAPRNDGHARLRAARTWFDDGGCPATWS